MYCYRSDKRYKQTESSETRLCVRRTRLRCDHRIFNDAVSISDIIHYRNVVKIHYERSMILFPEKIQRNCIDYVLHTYIHNTYIRIYTYINIYIYVYIHIHIYIHTQIYTYINT